MAKQLTFDRPRAVEARPSSRRAKGILYPLDRAYAQAGVLFPVARAVRPLDIPQPYRSLLVHERDMTLTLEQHYGGPVVLRVLSTFTRGRSYYRRVLLVQEYSGRPVEMGAIRIDLGAFAPRVRAEIQACATPLGRVLRDAGLDYLSRPKVFMSLVPNSEMMGVFWMREPRTLYGRRTEVILDGKKIGDIVEILPHA